MNHLNALDAAASTMAREKTGFPAGDSDVMTVLHATAAIESDAGQVMRWYCETPIAELNHLTARELVATGRVGEVLDFLRRIEGDDRE